MHLTKRYGNIHCICIVLYFIGIIHTVTHNLTIILTRHDKLTLVVCDKARPFDHSSSILDCQKDTSCIHEIKQVLPNYKLRLPLTITKGKTFFSQ
jgi:hypothetical protein